MKSFYIATALERGEEAKALSAELRTFGLGPTYEWWTHGSVQDQGAEKIREVAISETSGVQQADLFVALLPGGRGTHTEIGIALCDSLERAGSPSRGEKTLVLIGPTEDASGRTCAFYLHPHVEERFATVGEFLAWMRSWRRCNPLPEARHA